MILRWIKIGALAVGGLALVGGLFLGTDAVSYVTSSARSVREAVKDKVPVEFELRRARDMLEDIIPELHANIRLIAQEEVEVEGLKADIQRCRASLGEEQQRVTKLTELLSAQQVSYALGGSTYTRPQLKEDLARRFDRFREAEVVLSGKGRLMDARQKSLTAAMQMLDRMRGEKVRLEDQIASLESQHRLVKAASVGSRLQLDDSKLAQTERLIGEIKKRLDVAERILAHETRFVQPIAVEGISEADLLVEVNEYFSSPTRGQAAEPPQSTVALSGGAEQGQ